jgi:hypothetical protein
MKMDFNRFLELLTARLAGVLMLKIASNVYGSYPYRIAYIPFNKRPATKTPSNATLIIYLPSFPQKRQSYHPKSSTPYKLDHNHLPPPPASFPA